jgi:hypothetical protein
MSFSRPSIVPAGLDWETLHRLDGDELDVKYKHILDELGKQSGTLGVIFRKAQNDQDTHFDTIRLDKKLKQGVNARTKTSPTHRSRPSSVRSEGSSQAGRTENGQTGVTTS